MRRAPPVSFVPVVSPHVRRGSFRDHDSWASCQRPNVARSLSPRPDSPISTAVSSGQSPPAPSVPARIRGSVASAWADSRAGRIPSVRASQRIASNASPSVAAEISNRPRGRERGDLRPDARVVEAGRRRVGLGDLAVPVLEHHRARAVQDPRRPARERRGVSAGRNAVAGRLGHRDPDRRLADEPIEQPDRVRAAADAGQDEVGQAALHLGELGRRLVADPALEVAHDRRVGMRPHRRAQDVVGRLDVRDPVPHRLVDRVLERRAAGRHRPDLRPERSHPEHVRLLPLDVLGAHVHDARQAEECAGGGGRDAVLAGAGLGDHPGLAEATGQERLAEGVVDLVGAGMGEVLALEVDPESVRQSRLTLQRDRSFERLVGESIGAVEGRGAAGVALEQLAEVRPEPRVVAKRGVGLLELAERRHERLGDVASAELALDAPSAVVVCLEQPRVDRGRADGEVGPIDASGAGPFDEQRHHERVLARALVPLPRSLDPGGDVDADRRSRPDRVADGRRVEAAGEDDRDLAGNRGGERRRGAGPGAARVGTAGRVEEQAFGAGGEELATLRDDRCRGCSHVRRLVARQVDDLPGLAPDRGDRRGLLATGQLDGIRVEARDDLARSAPRPHRP